MSAEGGCGWLGGWARLVVLLCACQGSPCACSARARLGSVCFAPRPLLQHVTPPSLCTCHPAAEHQAHQRQQPAAQPGGRVAGFA